MSSRINTLKTNIQTSPHINPPWSTPVTETTLSKSSTTAITTMAGALPATAGSQKDDTKSTNASEFSNALAAMVQALMQSHPTPLAETPLEATGIKATSSLQTNNEPDPISDIYHLPDNHAKPDAMMNELLTLLANKPCLQPLSLQTSDTLEASTTMAWPDTQATPEHLFIGNTTSMPWAFQNIKNGHGLEFKANNLQPESITAADSILTMPDTLEPSQQALIDSNNGILAAPLATDSSQTAALLSAMSIHAEQYAEQYAEQAASGNFAKNRVNQNSSEKIVQDEPSLFESLKQQDDSGVSSVNQTPEKDFSQSSSEHSAFSAPQQQESHQLANNLSAGLFDTSLSGGKTTDSSTGTLSIGDQLSRGVAESLKALSSASETSNSDVESMKVSRQEISMVLNPESLGKVKLQLQSLGASGSIRGRIIVEKMTTASQIQAQLSDLTKSLAAKGITLEKLQIMTPNAPELFGLSESSSSSGGFNPSEASLFQNVNTERSQTVIESAALNHHHHEKPSQSGMPEADKWQNSSLGSGSDSRDEPSGQFNQSWFENFSNQPHNHDRSQSWQTHPGYGLDPNQQANQPQDIPTLEADIPLESKAERTSQPRVNILI
ncbi:MAG: flagellar hook-length control protein FliK [Vampirovibrionales bacterium]|nr:flagellar hook-length control protein FliK [Vampirovibrionales bacterium]